GKAVFLKNCAACHRLHGDGHEVGPDLAALANKSAEYLLTEILDPNRNVDTRYVDYVATTHDGRTFTGILASETATGIVLRGQEGREQTLLRTELETLHSTGKSLMPEGLEKTITHQEMADVLAYRRAGEAPRPDRREAARQTLDHRRPAAKRQALIAQHLDRAADLLAALTADLRPGTKEEYRRIPWIWRVAIAAGKRNDTGQLRRILDVALPKAGEPLHDWQAVVLGGGLSNGVGLQA